MINISIKNLRTEKPIHPWDVKVDRSSWFGNRFKMKNESERDNGSIMNFTIPLCKLNFPF